MKNDNETRNIITGTGNYIERLEGNYYQNFYILVNQLPKSTGVPQNIPRSSTDKFVGRKEQLIHLHQQLQDEEQVSIAHLEGMGGIGKTELAIIYSLTNLQCNTYPGGICWLRCREENIGLQIILFCRKYLDLKPPEDLELLNQVTWCWQHWQEGNTLIVFDDVIDYRKITSFFPPQLSQFKVLITTRLKLKLPSPLYLKVLSEKEALELLTQLVGYEEVNKGLEMAKLLCKRLGYLPLAIQLVGQYVEEYEISLVEEIKRLENKGLNDDSLSVEYDDFTWTSDSKGLKAAFELSWQELNNSAQKLGCLLSLFALAPIPWSLVENAAVGEDHEELKKARVKLKRLHLLQTGDSYQLHPLIQEFFREKLEHLSKVDQMKQVFASAIATVAKPQTTYWFLSQEEIDYLTSKITHIEKVTESFVDYLSNDDLRWPFLILGRYYTAQGNYKLAKFWHKKCLNVVQNRVGLDSLATAVSLSNLASSYLHEDRYDKAELLYKQALGIKKRIGVKEKYSNYSMAITLDNLGKVYYKQFRYEEAESLFWEAIKIRQQLPDNQLYNLAISQNNLANVYRDQGDYSLAKSLYLKAWKIYKSNYWDNHPKLADNLCRLAKIYEIEKCYEKAKSCYQKALLILENRFGKNHPITVICKKYLINLSSG